MTIFIISGLCLIVFLGLFLWGRRHIEPPTQTAPSCGTCDGNDSRCLQTCAMEAAVKEIEYFDDEELDVFKDRRSDSYEEEEVEQFRDVLYTMQQKEVRDWTQSLCLRGIQVPDQLKDELFLLLGDEG